MPLSQGASNDAPPSPHSQTVAGLQLVLDSEFLQAEYIEAQAAESPELQLVHPEFL